MTHNANMKSVRASSLAAIVQDGHPALRQKAKTLTREDIASPRTRGVIAHMKKLLDEEKYGVGLAAPQVGEPLRIFIISGRVFADPEDTGADIDNPKERRDIVVPPDRVFINPEITRTSKTRANMSEGCLSVRGWYGSVPRAEKATVRALDEKGKSFTLHGSGLLAQIFQHEVDHLEGVLYTDKATRMEISPEEDGGRAIKKSRKSVQTRRKTRTK